MSTRFYTRETAAGARVFAVSVRLGDFRLDGDQWTPLDGKPILGRLLDGDPYLDEIDRPESAPPLPGEETDPA
ncbi:MAG: hypothetical protein ACRDT9_00520 [Agromyces sp.]